MISQTRLVIITSVPPQRELTPELVESLISEIIAQYQADDLP